MSRSSISGMLKAISRTVSILLVVSAVTWIVASAKKNKFPPPSQIVSDVLKAPTQRPTARRPFNFEYFGKNYRIEPVAAYEISGLVVSHNEPAGFGDIYHDESSVDLRDLCLIFGPNAGNGLYQKAQFWSEPWTCFYKTKDEETWHNFKWDGLANNHLLSEFPDVRKKILNVKVGDQVSMHGLLVNYSESSSPEAVRQTSTRRDDTGQGACEVLWVEGVDIIKKNNPLWHARFEKARTATCIFLVMQLLTWLFFPFLEYRYG